ncbi:MAG: DEAD/DEAH box helicase, partial [Planctomycetales bacterium]|nr:DEAD/DEAH box helicase [Planctomycetales bacterium]
GGQRVLVLSHRKELLEQTAAKVRAIAPDLDYGVCCAGLGRCETDRLITFASIQSCYDKAADFGPIDVVIIDEAHLVPESGGGQYQTLFWKLAKINPYLRLLGLTATPYRTDTGPLCTSKGLFNQLIYSIKTDELIRQGFLCRLVTKAASASVDASGLRRRNGEFEQGEVEALVGGEDTVRAACRELVEKTQDRRHVLVFSAGVAHGQKVAETLGSEFGCDVQFVHGKTPVVERDEACRRFVAGELKYLVNCDLFTTGFDAPNVDCVAVLRPTASQVLWTQIVGRGLRAHPDKQDCLILDFGQNAERLGLVDDANYAPQGVGVPGRAGKVCPQCATVVPVNAAACRDCNGPFTTLEQSPSEREISEHHKRELPKDATSHRVLNASYERHMKRDAPPGHPPSLKVTYQLEGQGKYSEYWCIEHPKDNPAYKKACKIWQDLASPPLPNTVDEAIEIAESGGIRPTLRIWLWQPAGRDFPQLVLREY